MREILFRAKSIDRRKWYEGDLYQTRLKSVFYINYYTEHGDRMAVEVDPESISQFSGLTDKNGKKIFEGDILKQKTTPEFAKVNSFEWEHYGVVKFGYYDWDKGEAGYASMGWYIEPLKSVSIKPKNYLVGHIQAGLNQRDILNKYYPMEVIGNIHDNPELLKGGTTE